MNPKRRPGFYCCGILLFVFSGWLLACSAGAEQKESSTKEVTDALGRKVAVPVAISKIYPLRAGALRLICYLQSVDKVAYVELNEKKRTVPYLMAYPGLRDLTVLGVGNNVDPEHLAISDVDIVIATYMSAQEADALQHKSGKPVFVVNYGDLVDMKHDFYRGIRSLGTLLDKPERADSLVRFIEGDLDELDQRIQNRNRSNPTAYIGGIAFNGAQGITSTRVRYPSFYYLGIESPVDSVAALQEAIGAGQKNTLLDAEQLLAWDPVYIFLDAAGRDIWQHELTRPAFQALTARREGHVFTVLPFNWHTINYENLLCNTWFIGKTLYPDAFADVSIEEKSREIIRYFYSVDIFDEVRKTYHPFVSYAGEK